MNDGTKLRRPRINSAARYGLRRYAEELSAYAKATGDRVACEMLDCVNFLLIESDRIEGSHEP